MRSAIADLTPVERRGFTYGIFNTVCGASWFLASALIGLLYTLAVNYLILFVVVMEPTSIPLLVVVKRAT